MAEITALYNKLPADLRRFRLLTILPSDDATSIIECTLAEHNIDDADDQYDALSYCWGDANITVPVIVNGQERQVTVNLDNGLRQFRSDSFPSPMVIWADALCINQDDYSERGHQVKLMGDIYRKACRVRAWLGRGGHIEERGLRAIERMSRLRCTDRGSHVALLITTDSSSRAQLYELPFVLAVCTSPYWRRIWIVQELILNDKVTLYSGGHQCVVECWSCLVATILSSMLVKGDSSGGNTCPSALHSYNEYLKSFDLIDTAQRLARMRHTDRHKEDGTVIYLLHTCRPKLVTNELDRIYGLFGLLQDYLDIVPDYSKTAEALFEDVTIHLIEQAGSLQILRYVGSRSGKMPSWVPDFREPAEPFPVMAPAKEGQYRGNLFLRSRMSTWSPGRGVLGVFGVCFDVVQAVLDLDPIRASNAQQDDNKWSGDLQIDMLRPVELRTVNTNWFSTAKGFLGQMKQPLQVGDQVCILFAQSACSLFILRAVQSTTGPAHSLVGGCTIWRDWNLDDTMTSAAAAELMAQDTAAIEDILTPFLLV